MSEILLRIHSLTPYLFIVLMLVVLAMSIKGLGSGKFSLVQLSFTRVTMILAHIQLLFGLAILFLGDSARAAFALGMSNIMKTPELRLKFIEHPMMMIIAIALITIGFSRSKRAGTTKAKNRNILIFFGIAFVLIISRIPYAAWLNL